MVVKLKHDGTDGTGQMGQAVNHADGTPKDFEDISIATEWASFKIVKMKKKLFFVSHSL